MRETRTLHDPFHNKTVVISDRLTDRLRGKYACGPMLPNGEPEFGWNEFPVPVIQKEAADEIERLHAVINKFLEGRMQHFSDSRAVDDDLVELAASLQEQAA